MGNRPELKISMFLGVSLNLSKKSEWKLLSLQFNKTANIKNKKLLTVYLMLYKPKL